MNVSDYLTQQQKPLYDLFARARAHGRWSHAYLLHGYHGQPLLPIAQFLAQSLLCEQPSPLACGTCLTCLRFLQQDYTDIVMIDVFLNALFQETLILFLPYFFLAF